jgi:hypothetical protein
MTARKKQLVRVIQIIKQQNTQRLASTTLSNVAKKGDGS